MLTEQVCGGRDYAGKYGAASEQARALLSNMDLGARGVSGSIWSNWQDVTEREKAGCVDTQSVKESGGSHSTT